MKQGLKDSGSVEFEQAIAAIEKRLLDARTADHEKSLELNDRNKRKRKYAFEYDDDGDDNDDEDDDEDDDADEDDDDSGYEDDEPVIVYEAVQKTVLEIFAELDEAYKERALRYAYQVTVQALCEIARLWTAASDIWEDIWEIDEGFMIAMETINMYIDYDSEDSEFIFLSSLKDCRNEVFADATQFALELLELTGRYATKETIDLLYQTLDEIKEELTEEVYNAEYLEHDCLVRLSAMNLAASEEERTELRDKYLYFERVRQVAYVDALLEEDYVTAEKLCVDFLALPPEDTHPSERDTWSGYLLNIYKDTGNVAKEIEFSQELFMKTGQHKYFQRLRDLLEGRGTWEEEYPSLLKTWRERFGFRGYLTLLSWLEDGKHFMAAMREQPSLVFENGHDFVEVFPDEVYELCQDYIRDYVAKAKGRKHYDTMCDLIEVLYDYGGHYEARQMVYEFQAKYPRRQLLQNFLEYMEGRLTRRDMFEFVDD